MVSIIIATYNRVQVLTRSIESVLHQTHQNLEIIVVDDGSDDDMETFMKTLADPRARYIKLAENRGASAARNRGIAEAKGDYILVWDSDDVLYPHALEKILAVFEKHPEYAIVSAPARVLVGEKEMVFPKFSEGEVTLDDILLKRLPSNEKVRVARASVMKQVLYKSRNIDFLVNAELIEKGKWFHIGEFLGDVFNDLEKDSLTSQRRKRNAQRSIERAPHLVAFLEKHGVHLKKTSSSRYADYCYGAAIGLLLFGEKKKARHYAWEAARHRPFKMSYWTLWKLTWFPGGSYILKLFY